MFTLLQDQGSLNNGWEEVVKTGMATMPLSQVSVVAFLHILSATMMWSTLF
jgi:hypothetical protein